MLDDAELLDRIEGGEGDRVEFTASTTDLDKFRQAICAFANDLPATGSPGSCSSDWRTMDVAPGRPSTTGCW